MSQICKILFKSGDINIVVLRGIFLSRYVQLKSSFFDKKQAVKSETHFNRGAIKALTWQNIKGKIYHLQKLELCKVILNAKLYG